MASVSRSVSSDTFIPRGVGDIIVDFLLPTDSQFNDTTDIKKIAELINDLDAIRGLYADPNIVTLRSITIIENKFLPLKKKIETYGSEEIKRYYINALANAIKGDESDEFNSLMNYQIVALTHKDYSKVLRNLCSEIILVKSSAALAEYVSKLKAANADLNDIEDNVSLLCAATNPLECHDMVTFSQYTISCVTAFVKALLENGARNAGMQCKALQFRKSPHRVKTMNEFINKIANLLRQHNEPLPASCIWPIEIKDEVLESKESS